MFSFLLLFPSAFMSLAHFETVEFHQSFIQPHSSATKQSFHGLLMLVSCCDNFKLCTQTKHDHYAGMSEAQSALCDLLHARKHIKRSEKIGIMNDKRLGMGGGWSVAVLLLSCLWDCPSVTPLVNP